MTRPFVFLAGAWLGATSTTPAAGREPDPSPGAATPPAALESAPIEITVQQTRPFAAPATLETRVGGEEGRRGAGTQGDAVKALQALPGLARGGAGAGEVIAWGSAPRESRFYIDGVEVPALYHGSGIRSILPSAWVSVFDFSAGAYGAEHGRGLGGVVAIRTRPVDTEDWHAALYLDPLDAGASVSVALARGVGVSAAVRQSVVDRWLPQLTNADVGSLLSVPSYRDGQLKVAWDLSEGELLELVVLGSQERAAYTAPSTDPGNRLSEQRELDFLRVYLRYTSERDDRRIEVTPFVGVDSNERVTAALLGRSGVETGAVSYGLRAGELMRLDALDLRLGLDAIGTFTRMGREGTLGLPPREGDPAVFGLLPQSDVVVEGGQVHVLDVAPLAELTLRTGPFTLTPGLRLDTYLIETDRVRPRQGRVPAVGQSRALFGPEPRLSVAYDLDTPVRLLAAAGLYHQAPDPQDTSAAFGNPQLRLARSTHLAAGEELRLGPALSLSVLGYYKRLSGLAVRSPLPTPETARVLLDAGQGRSFGVQMLLRHHLQAGWSGWLAWTISRAERWQAGTAVRRFDFDQPHVVSAVLNKRLGSWSLGGRLRYATGSPRTPVIGASLNLTTDRYEPLTGALNSERLPDFFQLDLRVDRRFELGDGAHLSLYLDALNVTGHANAEQIVYGADYREREYLRGLPPLVVCGARLER